MEPYFFLPGRSPLLVSMPHIGTHVPTAVSTAMTDEARALPDTDWYLDRLYNFLNDLGASVLQANYSRYVIDLNRDPDSKPLYPEASNTELCPTTTFAQDQIYKYLLMVEDHEVSRRLIEVWRPYHQKLKAELETIKSRHGIAVLWDAHSIRSEVPRFFDGKLPDFNIGTVDGTSAARDLIVQLKLVAKQAEGFSSVVDGRFKGGYITRTYGDPENGVHAVQLELSQSTYMNEDPPYGMNMDKCALVRPVLRQMLDTALDWALAKLRH